jgi:hypothetical protein
VGAAVIGGADLSSCPPELASALGRGLDEGGVRAFLEAQAREGLLHGERALCPVLSPLVLSRRLYDQIEEASTLIMSAVERLVAQALDDPALADALGISDRERAWHALETWPRHLPAVTVGRLDMVFTEDSFAFIELNAESPAGLVDQAAIEATLYELPAVRQWRASERALPLSIPQGLLSALRQVYRAWSGGAGEPRVAIVDWRGDTTSEEEQLCRFFTRAGTPAVLVDPAELRYTPGELQAAGKPVDLVYRRFLARELPADNPLWQAVRDGAVCLANPLRSGIANKKAVLAVLGDPAWAHLFTGEEREAIAAHVPWSRVLDRQPEPSLLERREELVLKPNDDYGGRGVVLGWTVDHRTWSQALARGSREGAVVQARLRPRTLSFPTFDRQGRVCWQELGFDCDPFVFLGRPVGAMVRVSSSPLSNVSAGGGVTGLLVREDPGRV